MGGPEGWWEGGGVQVGQFEVVGGFWMLDSDWPAPGDGKAEEGLPERIAPNDP